MLYVNLTLEDFSYKNVTRTTETQLVTTHVSVRLCTVHVEVLVPKCNGNILSRGLVLVSPLVH